MGRDSQMSKIGFKMISDWVRGHDAALNEHKAAVAIGSKLNTYLVRFQNGNRAACQFVEAANEEAARTMFNQSTAYNYDVLTVEKRGY